MTRRNSFQFEYQQAQLEAEIENLSWKIEHAETTDRGDLENQIDIAEKRRTTLLKVRPRVIKRVHVFTMCREKRPSVHHESEKRPRVSKTIFFSSGFFGVLTVIRGFGRFHFRPLLGQ